MIERGTVFAIRSPRSRRGREQHDHRYAVAVQVSDLQLSTVIVAPTSTAALATSFRPEIEINGTRTRVLMEQLNAVDVHRLGKRVGALSWEELNDVDRALERVLGLTPGARHL